MVRLMVMGTDGSTILSTTKAVTATSHCAPTTVNSPAGREKTLAGGSWDLDTFTLPGNSTTGSLIRPASASTSRRRALADSSRRISQTASSRVTSIQATPGAR